MIEKGIGEPHMRKLCFAVAALLLLAAPALAQDAGDRTFAPGRVGAIVSGTKPADLARIYGAGNVKYLKIGYEGGESPGAHIFPGTPDYLEVVFDDDEKRIASVSILGRNWVNRSGLRKGTSLPQLERINGGPFKFQGFGADEGGLVHADGAALKPYTVYIALNAKTMPKVFHVEAVFSSRHSALKGVGAEVSFIKVAFGQRLE